jgi:hypothetical protein
MHGISPLASPSPIAWHWIEQHWFEWRWIEQHWFEWRWIEQHWFEWHWIDERRIALTFAI